MTTTAAGLKGTPDWLFALPRYVAGEPAPAGGLSLASNESQYGCSSTALAALSHLQSLERYPDPFGEELRTQVARFHDVPTSQVLLGNGSDELVQLLAIACAGRGGRVVAATPGYAMNRITALVAGAHFQGVPLKDWKHDLQAMADAAADITYIVNPHNPTGTTSCLSEIESAASRHSGLIVVDEAYIDFADHAERLTAVPLARRGKAAVLRTFSKVYGLAALRVGYILGPEALVERLARVRAPFSVNTAAQAAARAALQDRDFVDAHVRENRRNREALEQACRDIGLHPVTSQANFVLVLTPDEPGMLSRLRAAGVSVRDGSTLGVPGAIRITVPASQSLSRLIVALTTAHECIEPAHPTGHHAQV